MQIISLNFIGNWFFRISSRFWL